MNDVAREATLSQKSGKTASADASADVAKTSKKTDEDDETTLFMRGAVSIVVVTSSVWYMMEMVFCNSDVGSSADRCRPNRACGSSSTIVARP